MQFDHYFYIFNLLDPCQLVIASRVNKQWHSVATSCALWQKHFDRDFFKCDINTGAKNSDETYYKRYCNNMKYVPFYITTWNNQSNINESTENKSLFPVLHSSSTTLEKFDINCFKYAADDITSKGTSIYRENELQEPNQLQVQSHLLATVALSMLAKLVGIEHCSWSSLYEVVSNTTCAVAKETVYCTIPVSQLVGAIMTDNMLGLFPPKLFAIVNKKNEYYLVEKNDVACEESNISTIMEINEFIRLKRSSNSNKCYVCNMNEFAIRQVNSTANIMTFDFPKLSQINPDDYYCMLCEADESQHKFNCITIPEEDTPTITRKIDCCTAEELLLLQSIDTSKLDNITNYDDCIDYFAKYDITELAKKAGKTKLAEERLYKYDVKRALKDMSNVCSHATGALEQHEDEIPSWIVDYSNASMIWYYVIRVGCIVNESNSTITIISSEGNMVI